MHSMDCNDHASLLKKYTWEIPTESLNIKVPRENLLTISINDNLINNGSKGLTKDLFIIIKSLFNTNPTFIHQKGIKKLIWIQTKFNNATQKENYLTFIHHNKIGKLS